MKAIRLLVLSFLFMTAMSLQASQPAYGHFGVSFNYFYENLSPYGEWIRLDDGLVVWKPRMNRYNWEPYTQGGWMWTDCGWYWNSDEPYGDIVYHYGRWHNDDYYGWIWVPDYEWAPAWVQWRYDDDYIGWTPLPPYAMFSAHAGISFTMSFNIGYNRWHFVPYRHFNRPYISHYFVPGRVRYRIFEHTVVRNNYRYENDRVVDRSFTRDIFESRGKLRLNEQRINFRQTEGVERTQIRNNENRIEVGIPRERGERVDINTLTIKRGERNATLQLDKVRIGERVRTTERGSVSTQPERTVTTPQRGNTSAQPERNVTTPQRGNTSTTAPGKAVTTPQRGNVQDNSRQGTITPERKKETVEPKKNTRQEVRGNRIEQRNENKAQPERKKDDSRETRTRTR